MDNLLGMLALLGLLRALDEAKPEWSARAWFHGVPLRTQLQVHGAVTREEIANAAALGCAAFSKYFDFGDHLDLIFDGATARVMAQSDLKRRDRRAGIVDSALFSDAAVRADKEARVEATPLCAMLGQGHQHFLKRLHSVSTGALPRTLQKRKNIDLNSPHFIEKALFSRWERSDPTESFRWDFEEDRRYAYRAINPSTDAGTTEHGANRLAVLGLLSFQTAPVINYRSGTVALATRGVSRFRDRRIRITWPIWTRATRLATIEALLEEPELQRDVPRAAILRERGIESVRRVTRHMSGKFISFSRAETLTLA